jgi:pilus assembly protein CpaF
MTAVVYGLGPLERWIADGDVTEIMVNAGTEVWVERHASGGGAQGPQYVGRLEPGVVEAIIERILAPVGRRLDRSSPIVDTRLPDGSRLCAVLPPVAVDGPCLSLRRFAASRVALESFATDDVCTLLREAMSYRCNILVSGATSSGKTTLLNALAGLIGPGVRLVTLEDTAELASTPRTSCAWKHGLPRRTACRQSMSPPCSTRRSACGRTASSSARSAATRRCTWCKR